MKVPRAKVVIVPPVGFHKGSMLVGVDLEQDGKKYQMTVCVDTTTEEKIRDGIQRLFDGYSDFLVNGPATDERKWYGHCVHVSFAGNRCGYRLKDDTSIYCPTHR